MAVPYVVRNVPASEVDKKIKAMQALGATNIQKTANGNGTFDISCDFPD
jgi:hypothetical protein